MALDWAIGSSRWQCVWPRLIVALTALVVGSPAALAVDLTSPWPAGQQLDASVGARVTFPSHSPFVLGDRGTNGGADLATVAVATLFVPAGAAAAAPVPAVVLLHGAAGVLSIREHTYARQLAAKGVAALVVDAFAARRDRATSFNERLIEITEAMMLADAYAGLRFLAARPEIDADRVALVGFSYGGMAATYAAYAQVAERFAPDGERFVGHAAFYAPCIVSFRDNRATGAPLLMLYGGRDALVDPMRCGETVSELRSGGAPVEVVVYENAHHQWDGRYAGPRLIGRNLAGCRLIVDRNGEVRDGRWQLPMVNTLTRTLILGLCVDDEGYLIGRDDGVRALSNAALGQFLEGVFAVTTEQERTAP